ncbi:alpha/beta fold hydrolase [Chondromyces apiculatus]|uniref:Alpha/beta superfamily hydrolase n=1 Tax=Chondromyces apiculatus DSM 436 TaxID=1192034 RepID=A0A017T916_9BACT|nr:alpha/beta hydrolase [Chondromyces apiculatus]EYF05066.1 alpha/beta superfamily hydrolase [Chondromyces apiculatus DSM 436]
MNQRDAKGSDETTAAGGHVLAHGKAGAGDPLVLLHSGGFTSRQWRKLASDASPSHLVISPDLLGYGATGPWPEGEPFHLRQDLAALEALIDTLAAPVHLVGHSYGGYLALQLALRRPGTVRTLALFEPVAFGVLEPEERDDIPPVPIVLEPGDEAGDAWLERFIDCWNGPGAWHVLNAETQKALRSVRWKLSQEVFGLVDDPTPLATYATITAPTLLLGGARSPAFAGRILRKLAAALPAASLEILPDVGHMGPITHAPLVNAAILQHLTRHEAPSAKPTEGREASS